MGPSFFVNYVVLYVCCWIHVNSKSIQVIFQKRKKKKKKSLQVWKRANVFFKRSSFCVDIKLNNKLIVI